MISTRSRSKRNPASCGGGGADTKSKSKHHCSPENSNESTQPINGSDGFINNNTVVGTNWKWMPVAVIAAATILFILIDKNTSESTLVTSGLGTEDGGEKTKVAVNVEEKFILKHVRPNGRHDMNLRLTENGNKDNTGTNFNGFSFFLMGDTPYRDWQATRLELQMKEMVQFVKENPARNVSFTVHVGDIQKVDETQCNESAYELASDLMRKGPLPTLVLPGDNDYYDCPDRAGAFDLFIKYFGSLS
jgi:hypothetical protein